MSTGQDLDRALLAEPSRQSMVAVVFLAFRFVRGLSFVQIAVPLYILVTSRLSAMGLGVGVLVLAVWLAIGFVSWWRFTFVLDGDELKVSRGLISLQRLAIPLNRIQSVSVDQPVLHRLLGLVKVSVDTAGSSTAEFVFEALGRDKAEAVQRLAAAAQATSPTASTAPTADSTAGTGQRLAPPTTAPVNAPAQATINTNTTTANTANTNTGGVAAPAPVQEEVLVRRTPFELVKVGLSRWPLAGLVVIGPILALSGELADTFSDQVEDYLPDQQAVEDGLSRVSTGAIVGLIIFTAVAAVLIGWALQIVRSLITDWDLTITRTGDGLRRDAGLFSRTSRASRSRRVQALIQRQTPMDRLLGIREARLRIIGEGDLSIVGTTEAEVDALRSVVFADTYEPSPDPDRSVSSALIIHAVRLSVIGSLVVMAAMVLVARAGGADPWGWWLALPLLPVLLVAAVTARRWSRLRWAATPGRLVKREQILTSVTTEMETIKVQMVTVRQSPFQWRRGLATVELNTPEGEFTVPMLSRSEADQLSAAVLYGVEADTRAWM